MALFGNRVHHNMLQLRFREHFPRDRELLQTFFC